MKNQQLEITLKQTPCRPATRRQRRLVRARWWFNQMRRVVDEAMEWTPPSNTAKQDDLPLASR